MKFFATAFFAAGAVASIVKRQDAAGIASALGNIGTATEALTSAINAYDGGDQAPVLNAANDVSSAIEAANSAASSSGDLTLTDALTLQEPTEALGSAVSASVDAAIAKKDTFVSAGTAGIVLSQLQGFQSGSETLIQTIRGKVPTAAGTIVDDLTQPITDALSKGVTAFTGLGGATSSGSGSAPTSAATSGSAPTGAAPTGAAPTKPTGASTHSTPTATPPPFTGAASKAGFGGAAIAALLVAAL